MEGDGMRKLANLTVAAAMVLAASSQFALGGDKRPKQSGSAGCVQLSYGCLTCADGPCVIKTRPGNPITISTGSATTGGSSANLPKPKVSETKRWLAAVRSAAHWVRFVQTICQHLGTWRIRSEIIDVFGFVLPNLLSVGL
jgi:hypothetical protein